MHGIHIAHTRTAYARHTHAWHTPGLTWHHMVSSHGMHGHNIRMAMAYAWPRCQVDDKVTLTLTLTLALALTLIVSIPDY